MALFGTIVPNWLRFTGFVDWRDRGLCARFGILDGIHKTEAKKSSFDGIFDAFDIAKNISNDDKIVERMNATRFIRF